MKPLDPIIAALGDDRWRVGRDAMAAAAAWPSPDQMLPHLVALLDAAARR